MLTPRYCFAHDFSQFYEYFLAQPHCVKNFRKDELLWKPAQPHGKIHYIVSGAEMHYADHENGRRKIISFHSEGTIFPGYSLNDYKIELSLVTVALTDMQVLEFTRPQFKVMFESNAALRESVINWYSMYVNMSLFETIHQGYNSSLVKISNILYLLSANQPQADVIAMTQNELAEILGLSRVQLTRGLAALRERKIITTQRGRISVMDMSALALLCSSEAL